MAFNIELIGNGAVGALLGGLFSMQGHEVAFRGGKSRPRGATVGTLRILLPAFWLSAAGSRFLAAEEETQPDTVIIALGWQHLHALRRLDFQRITRTPRASLIFLNSDPAEASRLCAPERRASFGLTLMNAVKLQANEVELATVNPVLIIEKRAGLEGLFADLRTFGFRILAVDDIAPFADSFLLSRLLSVAVAMCNTTIGNFLSFPEGRELAVHMLEEGLLAMERTGRQLARLPLADPKELLGIIIKKPEVFERVRAQPDRCYNSVLQSFLRGKPSEAPLLMRRIVELASEAGVHPTWNWRVLQKCGRIPAVGFYRNPAELLRSLD